MASCAVKDRLQRPFASATAAADSGIESLGREEKRPSTFTGFKLARATGFRHEPLYQRKRNLCRNIFSAEVFYIPETHRHKSCLLSLSLTVCNCTRRQSGAAG
jgi:hypothetical protein